MGHRIAPLPPPWRGDPAETIPPAFFEGEPADAGIFDPEAEPCRGLGRASILFGLVGLALLTLWIAGLLG